ncbi:hypothetical protein [Deinococcus radiophilus]|uniref:DNA polymerase III beta sliding clamp C-terminal domain-containing protein n=2 Tax=Deinococcus radiophilus TaxID=32062 RepID=A0A431VES4_9DEIO|nr:hypothetical protein [Deinococcus radiophilus]RTR17901.1 hypothetical protein EJ104_13725 [Deinococcus radiophilus]UFA50960.1 hypothetical protein LMT64_03415 [Deinococcus radiophilus]
MLQGAGEGSVTLSALAEWEGKGLVKLLQVAGPGLLLHLPGADVETPDWRKAVPASRVVMKWPRAAVLNALEGLSLVAERTMNSRVTLVPGKEKLEFFVESDQGSASGVVVLPEQVKSRDKEVLGQPLSINGQYLAEAVRSAPAEDLEVSLCNRHKPLALRCGPYSALVTVLRN